ncbi:MULTISPECIES: hypothetical protein [Pseudomonas]|uniref:Uncharacterized protein n=1 Tax=Pseudomonas quebecensis TaxID=2995174 RepID=A0ABY6QIT2_9PSED|nr:MULTISPECIES: hypothetical protein [Pseudomonas]MCX4064867.1 hypothetical protein [Pseudomonas quebecensis]UZW19290.1 hypothetical protein OSC50_02730 [Pseudomonas quebecensis]UZW23295.1 hypothetical protein OSC48_22750 [Pseudomonas quebecensis]UZW28357.1 hypothetical protein OSC49_22755 [Pseudomonas quebecensis]
MNSFLHTSSQDENDHARFEIIRRREQGAPETVAYIRDIYQRRYGADMTPASDWLVARRNLASGALSSGALIMLAALGWVAGATVCGKRLARVDSEKTDWGRHALRWNTLFSAGH